MSVDKGQALMGMFFSIIFHVLPLIGSIRLVQ